MRNGTTGAKLADTPSDSLASQEVETVVRATQAVGGLIAETLAGLAPSVTMPQWRALVLAAEGPCTVSDVAEDLGIHASNATRLCDRLVRAGLVRRERADDDRRRVLITPTPAGRRLHRRAMEQRREHIEAALAEMTSEERSELVEGLDVFLAALHRGPRGSHRH
jgi:DNA-binding MarR family transcriptional regulator